MGSNETHQALHLSSPHWTLVFSIASRGDPQPKTGVNNKKVERDKKRARGVASGGSRGESSQRIDITRIQGDAKIANDYGRKLMATIPGAPNFVYGEFIKSATAKKREWKGRNSKILPKTGFLIDLHANNCPSSSRNSSPSRMTRLSMS